MTLLGEKKVLVALLDRDKDKRSFAEPDEWEKRQQSHSAVSMMMGGGEDGC